jgi:hypothetical protein
MGANSRHTPGPWRHAPLSDEVIGPRGEGVCAPCDGYDEEQWPIDARLLAKAPDLLAAARQYLDDLRFPPSDDSRARRIVWVERLIAEAEGC